jgi:hypothetical protein
LTGGINIYRYVENDPVVNIDPLGLVKWTGSIREVDFSIGPKLPRTPIRIPVFGRDEITLEVESECVNGKKVWALVRAVNPDYRLFALWANFYGSVELQDGRAVPDANSLVGEFHMDFDGLIKTSGTISTGAARGTFSGWGPLAGHWHSSGKSFLALPPKELKCDC